MKTLIHILDSLAPLSTFHLRDPKAIEIIDVVQNHRNVTPGSLFVAVQGARFDGHTVMADAVSRGAVVLVGQKHPERLHREGLLVPTSVPYIQVQNSRVALAQCAAALYDFPSRDMTVIGITGTDGKTTTCTILESILTAATENEQYPAGKVGVITTVGARVAGEELDTGFHVTTPEAPDVQRFLFQMRNVGSDYAIVESTSMGIAQERVTAIDFDVAAVTNITHEHLDWHGSRDAYVAAKAKLFQSLYRSAESVETEHNFSTLARKHSSKMYATPPSLPCSILNADDVGSYDALCQILQNESYMTGHTLPIRSYGMNHSVAHPTTLTDHLDVFATQINRLPNHTQFTIHWWDGRFPVGTVLMGDFNILNILCATTIALSLGITPERIQQGIARLHGVNGRMERIDCGQAFLALVDFAHSPASLERALTTLRDYVATNRGQLIAVFGSAGLRDVEKRRLMGQISGRLADFTIITAEDPRTENLHEINQEIAAGVSEHAPDAAFTIIPDRTEAIQSAVNIAQAGDVVAAFGKGHERSMCFGETEYPWNEQEVMREALRQRVRSEF
ncbi:UDP-N-acetylmuramoyl-L-alanyl-D-glutamate--2,6-diaminopimelate ligase [Chloroflexi bacterium TSY]|nr:UDP-N-acetylmuramoyl-L-alanyl-D-glutamate--2,6-diaminopimelate ligase [Chloroflexi bacterium TSY]